MHRRLARTADPATMRVSWTSAQGDGANGANSGHVVQWGLAAGELTNTAAAGPATTFGPSDLCAAPAATVGFVDPGFFHSALVGPLPATGGQQVFYRVGSEASGWSEEASFAAVDPERPTSNLLLTGDMGIGYGDGSLFHWPSPRAFATASHLIDLSASTHGKGAGQAWDAVLHVGDIAYATG
jgi:hypothetical protein